MHTGHSVPNESLPNEYAVEYLNLSNIPTSITSLSILVY